ncbi:MAG: hypothetical protein ACETWE_03815 [Candidatus Bathyarchaeia archaeon]
MQKVKEELRSVLGDLRELADSRPESRFYVLQIDKKNAISEEEISNIQNDHPGIRIFYASAS